MAKKAAAKSAVAADVSPRPTSRIQPLLNWFAFFLMHTFHLKKKRFLADFWKD